MKELKKTTFHAEKEKDFPRWYEEILKVADIVDNRYPVKGMVVWKPYGYKALKLMMQIMEDLLERSGHQEAYFPMLIPQSVFNKEAEFLEGFGGETYIITRAGEEELNEPLYVRPTSETVMYWMFNLWIQSKSDLPLKIYQTVNVFRYETKQTKAILRVREITKFKEAHTVHATPEEAENQIKEAIELYKEFFDSLLIPYLILRTPKWDTFAGAEYNYDFITVMPDGKGLELGSVINLGTKFAKAFDIKYQNDDGSYSYVYQTCYGISERTLGAVLAIHGDDNGLIFPPIIAPIQVVIVPIVYKGKEDIVMDKCLKIKELLEDQGYRVEIDDRDKRPGDKFYYWEAKGVPIRIELGPKDVDNNQVVITRRDTLQKTVVKDSDIINSLKEIIESINNNLRKRAQEYLKRKIFYYENIEEFKEKHKERSGIVALPWCGCDKCGQELEEIIDIPSLGFKPNETIDLPCAICGKKENVKWLYFGRTY